MTSPKVAIEAGVSSSEDVTEVLRSYPLIEERIHDEIEWYVSGPFRIIIDDCTVTASPIADDGMIDEYTWKQLIALHVALRRILEGEAVDLPILDNPGQIEITPTDEDVELTFDPNTEGWEPRSRTPGIDALAGAVLTATERHRGALLELNEALEESALIKHLDEQQRRTEDSIQEHGVRGMSDS